jgi:hypothetical protein
MESSNRINKAGPSRTNISWIIVILLLSLSLFDCAKSKSDTKKANKSENLNFKESESPQFTTSENLKDSTFFEDATDIKSKFINQE